MAWWGCLLGGGVGLVFDNQSMSMLVEVAKEYVTQLGSIEWAG